MLSLKLHVAKTSKTSLPRVEVKSNSTRIQKLDTTTLFLHLNADHSSIDVHHNVHYVDLFLYRSTNYYAILQLTAPVSTTRRYLRDTFQTVMKF